MDDMLLIDEDWYKKAVSQPDQALIIGHPFNRNLSYYKNISTDDIISEIKAVRDYSTGEVLGVVLIDINQQVFEDMQKSVKLGKTGFIFIIDENGNVIYSSVNYIVPRIRSEWFLNNSCTPVTSLMPAPCKFKQMFPLCSAFRGDFPLCHLKTSKLCFCFTTHSWRFTQISG